MTEDFSRLAEDIASIYATDTIFILGKGPSVDEIRPEVFSGSLVIGLNDAERIAPADATIFHGAWVKRALRENGEKSRVYITSTDFSSDKAKVVRAPFMPLSQDTSDLMMQRFLSPEFTIEEILFISALKLARYVAEYRGRPQTVYMVGFDFSPSTGYAHAISEDFAPDSAAEKAAKISIQEFFLLNTLYVLRNSDLDVVHVGNRAFSQISTSELNDRFVPHSRRDGDAAGGRHLVGVTAELTTNHFGDRHRLERMIRAAAAAGADFVKLQKRDVDTFYSQDQLKSAYVSPFGKTFGDYRHALELSRDDFAFVDQLCKELGVTWFASILDQPSFEFMLQFDPELVKLPSTISEHTDYLSYVASSYRKGIVLSTGMTDLAFEKWVLETFTRMETLYLMQANSAYPTPQQDCQVAVVRHYHDLSKSDPRIVPAYSSHDFGWLGSALAAAAGARMIEKHVKLGNTEWAHFDAVAVDLTTPAFKEYIDKIREAELIIGSEEKKVNSSEHHKYFRKSG
ncbi:N-acetylneuraminate synthase family protein [Ensifer soli]|uniref:N-acetylneuraminate synthase family protein n=1 Tax=Ciceribacter sp. sgz301302 TaxID=3342379 RepID=UPI0035B85B41